MSSIFILIILLNIFSNSQSINTKLVMHKNKLTEAQKDKALGIGLSELENGSEMKAIAEKLKNYLKELLFRKIIIHNK